MSFHTSLVVTRPVPSEGVKASPLRVRLFGIRRMVTVTLGWNPSTEKLVVVSWVLGGGSGAPVGGSAIGPFLVAARYTTTILYGQRYQQPQGPTGSNPSSSLQSVKVENSFPSGRTHIVSRPVPETTLIHIKIRCK